MPRVHDDPINELTSVYFYLSMALLQIMNFVVTLSSKVALDFAGPDGATVELHLVTILLYVLIEVLILHSRSGSL